MNKRGKNIKIGLSVFEISILLIYSFSISFIFSEFVGFGSGQEEGITGKNFINGKYVENPPPVTGSGLGEAPGSVTEDIRNTLTKPPVDTTGVTAKALTSGGTANIQVAGKTIKDAPTFLFNDKSGEIIRTANIKDVGVVKIAPDGSTTIIDPKTEIPGYESMTPYDPNKATVSQPRGLGQFIKDIYGGKAFGAEASLKGGVAGIGSSLVSGAAWGFTVYGAVKLLGNLFGLDKPLVDSLSAAGGLGVGAGVTANYLVANNVIGTGVAGQTSGQTFLGMGAGTFGIVTAIGVGVAVFLYTYKKEKKEVISFECLPWEPPLGGDKCDECNKPGLPCTEYRCRSLGQGCEIINQGTDKEMCFWKNKGDTQAPKINPNEDAFKPLGLVFRPDAAVSPPNTGFKIIDQSSRAKNGCIEAFTKLEFGITTNEPAQCRIDFEHTEKYEDMSYLFGESNYFELNRTQMFKIPDQTNASQLPEIFTKKNGVNTMRFYVRCIDGNGNGGNSGEVEFSFCVNPGPDTSPPIVEGGSIDSGSFVQFNADKVPYELYVNEPSECKWSRLDKAFNDMENVMSCPNQINANLDYVCTTELTGVKNDADNKFYFRCKDLPGKSDKDRNVMSTSFPLVLKGTKNQLVIEQTGPNGTITGGESVIGINLVVKTAFGVEDGKAICAYSLQENDLANYIDMDETNNYLHNQSQFLPQGNYQYFFKCVDAGGNLANASTSFVVKTDILEPLIARIFKDGQSMKIITNEDSECVYSLNSCSYEFDSGTAFIYDTSPSGGFNKKVHYTDWDISKIYNIKCQDLNGKRPRPDKCSVIIQGSEL